MEHRDLDTGWSSSAEDADELSDSLSAGGTEDNSERREAGGQDSVDSTDGGNFFPDPLHSDMSGSVPGDLRDSEEDDESRRSGGSEDGSEGGTAPGTSPSQEDAPSGRPHDGSVDEDTHDDFDDGRPESDEDQPSIRDDNRQHPAVHRAEVAGAADRGGADGPGLPDGDDSRQDLVPLVTDDDEGVDGIRGDAAGNAAVNAAIAPKPGLAGVDADHPDGHQALPPSREDSDGADSAGEATGGGSGLEPAQPPAADADRLDSDQGSSAAGEDASAGQEPGPQGEVSSSAQEPAAASGSEDSLTPGRAKKTVGFAASFRRPEPQPRLPADEDFEFVERDPNDRSVAFTGLSSSSRSSSSLESDSDVGGDHRASQFDRYTIPETGSALTDPRSDADLQYAASIANSRRASRMELTEASTLHSESLEDVVDHLKAENARLQEKVGLP